MYGIVRTGREADGGRLAFRLLCEDSPATSSRLAPRLGAEGDESRTETPTLAKALGYLT